MLYRPLSACEPNGHPRQNGSAFQPAGRVLAEPGGNVSAYDTLPMTRCRHMCHGVTRHRVSGTHVMFGAQVLIVRCAANPSYTRDVSAASYMPQSHPTVKPKNYLW